MKSRPCRADSPAAAYTATATGVGTVTLMSVDPGAVHAYHNVAMSMPGRGAHRRMPRCRHPLKVGGLHRHPFKVGGQICWGHWQGRWRTAGERRAHGCRHPTPPHTPKKKTITAGPCGHAPPLQTSIDSECMRGVGPAALLAVHTLSSIFKVSEGIPT